MRGRRMDRKGWTCGERGDRECPCGEERKKPHIVDCTTRDGSYCCSCSLWSTEGMVWLCCIASVADVYCGTAPVD